MMQAIMLKKIRYINQDGFNEERSVAYIINQVIQQYNVGKKDAHKSDEHIALREFGIRCGFTSEPSEILIVQAHQKIKQELDRINLGVNFTPTLKTHKTYVDNIASVRVSPGDTAKPCMVFNVADIISDFSDEIEETGRSVAESAIDEEYGDVIPF